MQDSAAQVSGARRLMVRHLVHVIRAKGINQAIEVRVLSGAILYGHLIG